MELVAAAEVIFPALDVVPVKVVAASVEEMNHSEVALRGWCYCVSASVAAAVTAMAFPAGERLLVADPLQVLGLRASVPAAPEQLALSDLFLGASTD